LFPQVLDGISWSRASYLALDYKPSALSSPFLFLSILLTSFFAFHFYRS
jgi:hypothetical protein